MKPLDSAARRALRARAHHLNPVVMIGEAGLTPAVVREIDAALKSHELIKIRVLGDERAARKALVGDICEQTGAEPVQQVGKIVVVFREKPAEEAKAEARKQAPKRAKRKAPRRLKRSFQ